LRCVRKKSRPNRLRIRSCRCQTNTSWKGACLRCVVVAGADLEARHRVVVDQVEEGGS